MIETAALTNGTHKQPPDAAPMAGTASRAQAPRLLHLGQLVGEWEADARAAFDARTKGIARGPVTGLKSLDDVLGGVLQVGTHVVHGGPGVGKTAFALQVSRTSGVPALYITAEMRPLELCRRLTASVTETFLGRLKSGEMSPEDSVAKFRQACAAAPQLVIADATDAFASPEWLRQAAAAVRGQSRHLLIVVDSVHAWADSSGVDLPEYDRLNAAVGALRTLAGQLSAAIIAIAERNRSSMSAGGLSASAGSRKFEYSGESVLDLSADEKAPPGPPNETPIVVHVAKNRNGAAGRRLRLNFNGALQRFTDAEM